MLQNIREKVLKETIWSILTKGTTLLFFIPINIILARFLGVELYGQWSFVFSLVTVFSLIAYFGVNQSAQKFVAQHNHTDHLYSVLIAAIVVRVIVSTFFILLFLLTLSTILHVLDRPELFKIMLLSLIYIFFSSIVEFLKSIFSGLHTIKSNFTVNILEYGLKLVISLLVLLYVQSVFMVMEAFSLAVFITAIFCMGLLINAYKLVRKNIPWQEIKTHMRDIFYYSIPLFFVSIGFIVATELDTLMVGFFYSDTEVGIYSVAKQIISKTPHIALAIAMGVMPLFAKIDKENVEGRKKLLKKIIFLNTVIFGFIGSVFLLFGTKIMVLFFGEAYIRSGTVLKLLVPFMIVYSYSVYLSTFLDYQGLAKVRAFYVSASLILNIILNIFLIPKYGASGAAISTSLSFVPSLLVEYGQVRRQFNRYR